MVVSVCLVLGLAAMAAAAGPRFSSLPFLW